MGLTGFLLLCFGLFTVTYGSDCVAETTKCSKYWVKIEPHRDFMESEEDLDVWCSKQLQFLECLETVLGNNGSVSQVPTNLLISKLFAEDLCTKGSTSRSRYLNNAVCMNQLSTEFCTEPEYLDIVIPDNAIPPNRCSLAEKSFSCIAATIVLHCGFDAGRVYRNMLKIVRYGEEVCDADFARNTRPCTESSAEDRRDEKLSGIFYDLVHRMGSIPEQDPEILHSDEFSETRAARKSSDEAVTEAIKTALDSLEKEDFRLNELSDSSDMQESLEFGAVLQFPEGRENKNPHIIQLFGDILVYNYSDKYVIYWRQPDLLKLESISCRQGNQSPPASFHCEFHYRGREDLGCPSNEAELPPLSPAIIRDSDPEVPDDSSIEIASNTEGDQCFDDLFEQIRRQDQSSSTTELPMSNYEGRRGMPNEPTPKRALEGMANVLKFIDSSPVKPYPVTVQRDGLVTRVIFRDTDFSAIESLTCGFVNRCHPTARGVMKCTAMPRVLVEEDPAEAFYLKYGSPESEVHEAVDPTESVSTSPDVAAQEHISLVFSGDVGSRAVTPEPAPEVDDSYMSDQSAEVIISYPEAIDSYPEIASEDNSSPVRVLLLDPNYLVDADDESSVYVPQLVYEIDSMESLDDEQMAELTSDGDVDESVLLLHTTDDVADEAEYATGSSDQVHHRIGSVSDAEGVVSNEVDDSSEAEKSEVITGAIEAALDLLDMTLEES